MFDMAYTPLSSGRPIPPRLRHRDDAPYPPGRWVCWRDHVRPSPYGAGYAVCVGPIGHDRFGNFAICMLAHEPLWPWAINWLSRIGFLDAASEGDVYFWRLDFWNATLARELRKLRR